MLLYYARNQNNGFTLVEMIVAVIIVGVLAAISAPNLLGWYNRNRANAALEEIEGAIREAQRQATRNGQACTIDIDNTDRELSGGCLLGNRVFDDYITLNSDQATISFTAKGTTTTNALIQVTTNGNNVQRCLVITSGLGLIRTGDMEGTECKTRK